MEVRKIKTINLTTSGLVKTGPGLFFGIALSGSADAATAVVYDNTSGSGTVLATIKAGLLVTAPPLVLPHPVEVAVGIYVTITGTTPAVQVLFE